MKKIIKIMVFILLAFPVFTVAEDTDSKSVQEVNQAAEAEEQNFLYDPKDRRDPFAPLVDVQARSAAKKQARILGTLESYDIADFRLVAIIEKKNRQNYGLLVAADNKSFTVREGTVIGLNKGKVKEINSNEVVIVEYIKDFKGDLKPREVVLELRIREGEGK